MSKTIKLPYRLVERVPQTINGVATKSYVVIEMGDNYEWTEVSKKYAHSTSAFAALGRLVQKDVLANTPEEHLPIIISFGE